ncbi:facilitated trehalose transporter Tret1-2 homolog isoform X1 [Lutzomyia longipalpis]|uniref:facilitated trehalose transporter Tret1-2 homolog isoform X1 n=1 Tax=Lutzomyia longipalpis TaxID=7200 RepID=UPI0024846871|nr:facilitated trehalose transporter Tret1-2 homolog isoform X1 [Lutzomyia longipalpis]
MVLNIRISGKLVQFLGAICANFGGIVYGLMVGWPSATMPILSSTDSPLPSGPLTKKEVSWVISIMMLGGMLGTIIFGWMANHFGRKWPLIVGMLPQVVAQSLIATAQNTSFLYTARFLSGVSGGALLVLVSIYVNEISENSIRGTLGSILGIFYGFGVIIAYIICAYMPFYSVPYVGLGILALFLLFIIFPESPQYLLLKQKDAEAEKSLKFFRGSSRGDQVKLEFESLKSSIDAASTKSNNITLQDFKPATTRKALLVSYIILSGRNLSGVFVLMNYTVDIFQQAGTGIDAHISAIIVGTIQLAGTVVSAYYTDKSGRRILLISSLIGLGLCLTAIGIYFRLNEQGYNLSSVFWLPIASLSGIMFLGGPVQNIPVYVLSELLPTKIRGPVATVYMASVWPVTFLILQFYTPLADLLGIYGCMWIFAGWCFFEAVFAYFMLPETKGRNPEEIVKALEGKI